MILTYKFRIYPTKKQIEKLNKNFDCTRFVYNFFLNYSSIMYKKMNISTNYNDWACVLVKLKQIDKYSWLNMEQVHSYTELQSKKKWKRKSFRSTSHHGMKQEAILSVRCGSSPSTRIISKEVLKNDLRVSW